jgi:hypothetical protein
MIMPEFMTNLSLSKAFSQMKNKRSKNTFTPERIHKSIRMSPNSPTLEQEPA